MKNKEKSIKRELGASLPSDLRQEYKKHYYNETMKDWERKSSIFRKGKESIENEEDFKSRMKAPEEIDHEKAKENVAKANYREIHDKVVKYILDKGLKEEEVKINIKTDGVEINYINESGEIIREKLNIKEVLNYGKETTKNK